jgi:hypothetical protein
MEDFFFLKKPSLTHRGTYTDTCPFQNPRHPDKKWRTFFLKKKIPHTQRDVHRHLSISKSTASRYTSNFCSSVRPALSWATLWPRKKKIEKKFSKVIGL